MATELHSLLDIDVKYGLFDETTEAHQVFNPRLIRNDASGTMLHALKTELARSHGFHFSVAFVTPGGLALLKQDLLNFKGRGTLLTSTYLGFNSPATFRELASLKNLDVHVIPDASLGFHSKAYLFNQGPGMTAIVGSSNLTRGALLKNSEWNLRVTAREAGALPKQLSASARDHLALAVPLSPEWIDNYETTWQPNAAAEVREVGAESVLPSGTIKPNTMQVKALEALATVREVGEQRALIVSATGTGKTILAALAAQEINPDRILFVAHREQILIKAREEFRRVLGTGDDHFGIYSGQSRDLTRRHIFATIQSLSRPAALNSISPTDFDLIIVDEVHRAAAATYLSVLGHLEPKFLLGLTATPERTDGFNVFELFDHNVPYEIRLQDALESDMLVPFNYYGVEDYVDEWGNTIDDLTDLARLSARTRVDHIVKMLTRYGHTEGVKGLMFCSRNEEAQALSDLLNGRTVHGKPLRTVALSGKDSIDRRQTAVQSLESGDIDYILTVDIFNEGIDIPSVNQVVMLRSTQSSIVFTQQLGRGLRKAPHKDHLRVIDFIGNYKNNFLIPIALFGDSSLNKDVVRKRLIEAETSGSIAGISSINFTNVARDRVFKALASAQLDSLSELKQSFLDLEQRLGTAPKLYDFARFKSVDPVIVATKKKNYWQLLRSFKRANKTPTSLEDTSLTFLSYELLNGKRPHELHVLAALLRSRRTMSAHDLSKLLSQKGCTADTDTVRSVIRLLTLEFSTQQERTSRYGDPIAVESTQGLALSESFTVEYDTDAEFREHVDDIIATGLHLSKTRYQSSSTLVIGERYSRKDACRLLNWSSNQQGVIYGYKTDSRTNTCPIFVTYHKSSDVSENVAYGDEFLDPGTMRWFTRSKLTLDSGEVRQILDTRQPPDIHLFVKKDDAEGSDFYYLGLVTPSDAKQGRMPTEDGRGLDVVTMKLSLAQPMTSQMFDYFQGLPTAAQTERELQVGPVDAIQTPRVDLEPPRESSYKRSRRADFFPS